MGEIAGVGVTVVSPVLGAAQWVEEFLNVIGGDFVISKSENGSIVLTNKRSCPCFNGTPQVCNEYEKIVNIGLKRIDPNVSGAFTQCGNTGDICCKMVVTMDDF